jgi:hypothetical protein
MASHCFISYSEGDKTLAETLLTALERRGATCWIAPRDIPPGGSYADAIMRAIEASDCFLLIYTAHSNASPHVLREVERALKFERNIIPIRFDDSQPSRSLDYLLATVQWLSVDLSKESSGVNRVADQIMKCVAPRELKESPPKTEPARGPDIALPSNTGSRLTLAKVLIPSMILLAIAFVLLLSYNFRLHEQKQFGEQVASASPPPSAVPLPSLAAQVASAEKREASLASPSPFSMQATATQPEEQPEISQQSPNAAKTSPEESAPQNVVRQYFDSFADRNVSAAYNLFSKAFRNSLSFRKYSDLFSATREIKLSESTLMNQTRDNAVVFVQFEEITAEYTAIDWRGPIELVREGSEWRIKTLRGLKKVSY